MPYLSVLSGKLQHIKLRKCIDNSLMVHSTCRIAEWNQARALGVSSIMSPRITLSMMRLEVGVGTIMNTKGGVAELVTVIAGVLQVMMTLGANRCHCHHW